MSFHEFDIDAEEGRSKIALLFRNERAANNAADDYDEVADFLELEWDTEIDDTEADGRFVVGEEVFDLFEDSSSQGSVNTPAVASARGAPAATAAPAPAATAAPASVPATVTPTANVDEEFFAECQREMVTELGAATSAFCECLWEGMDDLRIDRNDRLRVVETYVEGQTPEVDLVVENCAFNVLLGS